MCKIFVDKMVYLCYIRATITKQTDSRKGRKEKRKMAITEMKEYLLEELKEEKNKMFMNKENHYSYILMICNDMGIIEEQ